MLLKVNIFFKVKIREREREV